MPNLCPAPDQLSDLLSDRLDEEQRTRLESHLGECPACQQALLLLAGNLDSRQWQMLNGVCRPGTPPPGARESLDAYPEPSASFLERLGCLASRGVQSYPSIPGFEILAEVGRGGMAIVYKARQTRLNRVVALKVIQADNLSPERLSRARRGAEIIAGLKHPNILRLFEVGKHENLLYGVCEDMEGGDLHQKLKAGVLPPRQAAQLLQTIARAVQFFHDRGIVHRDLKPANILLTAEGTPKVADFGLARFIEENNLLTLSGDVVGTPSHMAPEQVLARSDKVGPGTDVYALGVIGYEMLTGRPPFHSASRMEILYQIVHLEPMPPCQLQPGIPRDLEIICLKCLHKEMDLRYRSAGELADDLDRFLKDQPIRARPVSAWERSWKWARQRPAVVLLTGLLLVVALVGSLTVLWERRLLRSAHQEAVRESRETRKALQEMEAELAGVASSLFRCRLALARHELERNRVAEARRWLSLCQPRPGQPDLRDQEWQELWRRCQQAAGADEVRTP